MSWNGLFEVVRGAITQTLIVITLICMTGNAQAAKSYSPNDVYAGVDYVNRVIQRVLENEGIADLQIPVSHETAAKPMHVYELHVAVLNELYQYALKNDRRPPPLATSTPIKYTPTDVYYLTQLIIRNTEDIHIDLIGEINFSKKTFENKTPANVYQALFELYYKVNRLNGKSKISPSEVYAHIYRAKEDLQYSLLILSKSLHKEEEEKKRMLTTAVYGMHPDGTLLPAKESGRKPADVLVKAFEVRSKLNNLREKHQLKTIIIPKTEGYSKVKPIDVFLQTQFIIAELNLLKMPMGVNSTTNSVKPVSGKTPSDVYYEMMHINYMLERLIQTL